MKIEEYKGYQIDWFYDDPMYSSVIYITVEKEGETVFDTPKFFERVMDKEENRKIILETVKKEIDVHDSNFDEQFESMIQGLPY